MLKYIAMSIAAFLPVGAYQLSKFNYPLNDAIKITASLSIGAVWFLIENNVYFSGIIAAGSYFVLRMK